MALSEYEENKYNAKIMIYAIVRSKNSGLRYFIFLGRGFVALKRGLAEKCAVFRFDY